MMDYGGGDLLLAGPLPVAGSLRIGLCMQALGGGLKTAWLSFSDEKRVRGVCDTTRAIYTRKKCCRKDNRAMRPMYG